MKKASLRNFDPEYVATLDSNMWKAYYRHEFLKLFLLLIKLIRTQFNLNYLNTLRVAYYLTSGATLFRLKKGREDREKILKKLVPAYEIINNNSKEVFDYKKAAEAELEWWFIDRYPDRYQKNRVEALSEAMALLYEVPSINLQEYARYRADAMVMQDVAEADGKETDWTKVEILLKKAWFSLHRTVNT